MAERSKPPHPTLAPDPLGNAVESRGFDDSVMLEGVVHRINNPLASMLIGLARLSEQLASLNLESELAREVLRTAQEARSEGERVANAVRELRALFPADVPRRVDAQGVLGSVLAMLEQQDPRVVIRRRIASVLPVFVREARFAQVFRSAGQLLIEAQREHRPSERVELLVEADEREGQLRVSLGSQHGEQATDKLSIDRTGKLSMLRGMVQQLGGSLTVQNGGLRLALPVEAPIYESELEVDLTRRLSAPPRGEMRILVVDDEVAMHRALTRGLSELGHVQAVRSMEAAIELLQGGATYDVILSDLIMPEGTGLELVDWLAEHQPKLRKRMILMTGMGDTHADQHPDIVVVGKPFDLPALRELVCQVATRG